MCQCGQSSVGAEQAADVIGEWDGDPGRRPVGIAGNVTQAADRFGDDAVASALAVRTGLTEPANADHDDSGIDVTEIFIAESPTLQCPRTEVLDHEVAFGDHAPDQVLTGNFSQIQGDVALVAHDAGAVERFPLEAAAVITNWIALGLLHLENLRAEVGE